MTEIKIRVFEERDQAEAFKIWEETMDKYTDKLFWKFLFKNRVKCIFIQALITSYMMTTRLTYGFLAILAVIWILQIMGNFKVKI
jgi:hypothetical protein